MSAQTQCVKDRREEGFENNIVSEEDQQRANIYRLLARSLSAPPDQDLLTLFTQLTGDETVLGSAFSELGKAASKLSVEQAAEEYQNLFIGLGRGELLPFASYYLTGFLHEKPLARLRYDMAPLGIERNPAASEPEDHAGAIMDMMAGIIDGSFKSPESIDIQKKFFERHIASWMPYFFKDLQEAKEASVYRPLGKIGEVFIEIERVAFDM